MDLVDAHVLGLKWLLEGKGNRVFCLGSGTGFSVREVIEASRAVTNRAVPIVEGARRAGDATTGESVSWWDALDNAASDGGRRLRGHWPSE